jgi:hypothetical protein
LQKAFHPWAESACNRADAITGGASLQACS